MSWLSNYALDMLPSSSYVSFFRSYKNDDHYHPQDCCEG